MASARKRPDPAGAWSGFVTLFAATSVAVLALLFGAVAALDPFGSRVGPGRAPTPIMDLNQRYMYPQLARSGGFDSAIFGTSTIRLLDPRKLGAAFGGRFANLGLNAGTPWEQLQLAALFLRHVPRPATIILGLDRSWCDADADDPSKRLTFRSFPPWLYDDDPLNDWPGFLSLKSLEIALRVALHRLGRMPERIRGDGYEVFLPADRLYDPARAKASIHAPSPPGGASAPAGPLPALDRLAEFVGRVPPGTRLVLLLPPIHVAAQAAPGSAEEAADAACKARIRALARRPSTWMVDFRLPSSLTREDGNYWDRLHYRLPVADGLVAAIAAAIATGQDDPAGLFRVASGGG